MAAANKELERLRELLRQQEKLASIGLLTSGVAQEIRKPISFILESLRVLEDSFADITLSARKYIETFKLQAAGKTDGAILIDQLDAEADKLEATLKIATGRFSQSFDEIERMHQILEDLSCYSKTEASQRDTVDIHECIDAALRIVHSELKYQVNVKKVYAALPELRCYPRQLTQAFVNLFMNSVQAIPDNGELKITTLFENEHIAILVKDDGTGIPESLQHRVFDPFFTTKEGSQGSGLGLCIVDEIIRKHNGYITFTSAVGRGTEFRIELPVEQQKSNS